MFASNANCYHYMCPEDVFHIVTEKKSWVLPYSLLFCLTAWLEYGINFFACNFDMPHCWAHQMYSLFHWSLEQCHMKLQLSICYSLHYHWITFWTCTHTPAGKACDSKYQCLASLFNLGLLHFCDFRIILLGWSTGFY